MAWYDPVSWFNDAKNDALSSYTDVKNFVLSRVKQLADELHADLDDLRTWAKDGLKDGRKALDDFKSLVDEGFDAAKSFTNSVVGDAIHDAEHYADDLGHDLNVAISGVESEAKRLIGDVETEAKGLVKDAESAATELFHKAETYADGVWNTAYRTVVEPFIKDVAQDFTDVRNWVTDGINALKTDVIDPIERGLEDAEHDVALALDWIRNTGESVATTVIKASDWLLWFGEHTFDDLTEDATELEKDLTMQGVEAWAKANLGGMVATANEIFAKYKGE